MLAQHYPRWKGIFNRRVFLLLSVLFLVVLLSGCLDTSAKIPSLLIGKTTSAGSYPVGNLTRTDVVSIPILVQAIDEVLASSSMDQKEYYITQDEWDQIAQLFFELVLPPQHEGDESWYVSFEGTLLAIYLGYIAAD
jgi:hypothetical protein